MAGIEDIVGSNIDRVLELDTAINKLDATFMKVLKSAKETSSAINLSSDSYAKLKVVQEETTNQTTKLSEAEKQQEKIAKEQSATLAAIEKQRQKAYEQIAKQEQKEREMTEAINKEVRSIKDAEAQNKALLEAKKKLNLTTEEGRKANEKYNQMLDKNTKFIRENSDAATKQRMNIGNYKSALEGIGTKLLAIGSAFGVSIGAVKAFNAIIKSTQNTTDFFEQQIGGIKESMSFFARSIATLDFSNLISGLNQAYQEGIRYAGALDEIADRQRALGIQKLDIEGQIIQQRIIAKNRQLDLKDRLAAIDEIVRLEELKLTKTKDITQEAIDNELQNAATRSKMTKEEVLDFVKNYDQYSAKILEGQKIQEHLDSLVETIALSTGGVTVSYVKQKEAIKNLTPEQEYLLELYHKQSLITDEVRDKVAAALKADISATNEKLSGEEASVKMKNRLYNELIKQGDEEEKLNADTLQQQNDLAEKTAQKEQAIADRKLLISKMNAISVEQVITDAHIEGIAMREQADIDTAAREMERLKQQKEERIKLAQEYVSHAQSIGQTLLDFNQFIIDTEVQKMEQAKAYELEMAGDNAVKRADIEKKYEKEAAKLKAKQAKQDKATALFSAIIKTAQAVLAGLAYGPPLGYVFAALNAALGAIQIGVIASQPIPQFAKGTMSAPDGVISVAEGNKREIIQTRSGKVLMANRHTLLSGMKGARIYSNPDTEKLLKMRAGFDSPELRRTLTENNDKLIRTIQNKKEIIITPAKGSRITERQGNYYRHYINRKLGQS